MSDWETEPDAHARVHAIPDTNVKKWEGEDEQDAGSSPASDWDASSSESSAEENADGGKNTQIKSPPLKKKGTVKAKIAAKAAAKAPRAADGDGGDDDDVEYDEDAVLDPREKARLDREREIKADLDNAAALFGASAAIGGPSSSDLHSLISANPRTKEDFQDLSAKVIEFIIKRHQNKPLYPSFVEHHVRELCQPLKDVETRKAASTLTTLANEKQKEQREKVTGKKKPKAITKPVLGSAKVSNKFDMGVYDEALDDFGTNQDDFM